MSDSLLHPELETLSPADTRARQDELWEAQWAFVIRHSAFYKRKLLAAASRSASLNALAELPFTEKDELRESQRATYPFGDYVACSPDRIVRVHRTSGTTGKPLQLAHSRKDADLTARIGGRSQFASGLRPGDRVVHCLNYCLWTGGVTDHMTLEEAGACVIPFGVGSSGLLLDTIDDLSVTAISCTPSYPALLADRLRERRREPRTLKLRLGLFGGEAGLDNVDFRRSLEDVWGFGVRNANYGMSEILSNFASQCERSNDLHFHGWDAIFPEIVDGAGASQQIREGTTGELVCTHLAKECQPLIRFKTRDVVTVTGTGLCACGRTTWRFRVTGRTDDMFNVRGINVFPTAVQAGIMSRPDLASGQFRILLHGPGPWDRIVVRAEAVHGLLPERFDTAALDLEFAIKQYAGASATVILVDEGTLPRSAGKTSVIERS